MSLRKNASISRREFIKLAGIGALEAGAASVGPYFLFSQRVKSHKKQLRILQWKHPIQGYDEWFQGVLAKEWGEKNDTEVTVDFVPGEEIDERASKEAAASKGHDLTMFMSPPARYERYGIDHKEVYQEAQARHGQMILLAYKSTFNPKTRKYFAFSDCYMPVASNWLSDSWKRIGLPGGPTDYDTLRSGAKQIRKQFGIPCGLGLAKNLTSNVALVSLLWSFGAVLQDERGNVAINSKETIEALKYMRTLYQESEMPEVLTWRSDSNVRDMLDEKISFTMNAIFLSRAAERKSPEVAKHILVNPALRGHFLWLACPHITSCYVIWDYAENKDGAKRFLVNLIDNYSTALQVSELCNFPCFPSVAPNLLGQLSKDPQAEPAYKYMALEDALHWTRNIGYPGYATAATDEVFANFVIPAMFAQAVRGRLSPEDAAAAAEKEVNRIVTKWEDT